MEAMKPSQAAAAITARHPISPGVRALNPGLFAPTEPAKVALPSNLTGDSRGEKKGRQMNKTEARFAAILQAKKQRGEIVDYVYEGVRLKWGIDPKTGEAMWYKPDFFVTPRAGKLLCIEIKGAHIRYQDSVRYKGARSQWTCFDFEMWQWAKGEWTLL